MAWIVGPAFTAISLFPVTVVATQGEHELWLGVGADTEKHAAVEARYVYNLSDFWAVGAIAHERRGSPLSRGRTSGLAEVRTVIDALTFVPAISLAAGPAVVWPGTQWTTLARIEVSVAWRPERNWAAICRLAAERSLDGTAWNWMLLVGVGTFGGAANDLDY